MSEETCDNCGESLIDFAGDASYRGWFCRTCFNLYWSNRDDELDERRLTR
jgi:hypothetical protein